MSKEAESLAASISLFPRPGGPAALEGPALPPDDIVAEMNVLDADLTQYLASGKGGAMVEVFHSGHHEVEDLGKLTSAFQNVAIAAKLVDGAENLALATHKLTPADIQPPNNANAQHPFVYTCDSDSICSDCNRSSTGGGENGCSAACRHWTNQWQPILDLIDTACCDSTTQFESTLPMNIIPTINSNVTTFQNLAKANAQASKPHQMTEVRTAFLSEVYTILCDDIGEKFFKTRAAIYEQIWKIDAVASGVHKLCASTLGAFSKDSWLTKSAASVETHVGKCKPFQVTNQLETMNSTAAALLVAEKSLCSLANWCNATAESMQNQKDALVRGMPIVEKVRSQIKSSSSSWKRAVDESNVHHLDIWKEHIYGQKNCATTEENLEKFKMCLLAYLDLEPDCRKIYRNGVVFFRDCYADMVFYMNDHIKRVRNMQQAFMSLSEALVQQRFVVEIGAFLMRSVSDVAMKRTAKGRLETPVDYFKILFGPQLQKQLQQHEFVKIQIELDSKGAELGGAARSILTGFYQPNHINSIQRVAQKVFTAELESLGQLLSQCDQFKGSQCAGDEEWQKACNRQVKANMRELNKVITATVVYLDKKHACTTKHCDCCPSNAKLASK